MSTSSHAPAAPSPAFGFLRELEGLRAIAIAWVMLHRFWPRSGPLAAWSGFAELGWVGVDLFFVISGFLIAGILLENRGEPRYYRDYYARRALRILPLYYVFVGLVLTVLPLAQGGPYFDTPFVRGAGSPLWYLLHLGNVPEMIGHEPPFLLGPVWSLAIEEQFYLLFPFVVARIQRRTLARVLAGAILFAPLFRLATAWAFPENERIQYLATPARIDTIALGCLLAVVVRSPRFRLRPRDTSLLLAAALALFAVAFATSGLDRTTWFGRVGGYSVVGVTCAAVVLWAVTHREQGIAAPLRLGPVMYVGKLCYGLYLLHRPASALVDGALARVPLGLTSESAVAIALKLAVALGLASASWYAFERPILALKRHFASRGPENPNLAPPGREGDPRALEACESAGCSAGPAAAQNAR